MKRTDLRNIHTHKRSVQGNGKIVFGKFLRIGYKYQRFLTLLFIVFSVLFFNDCSKKPKNFIKVANNYTETLLKVTLNSVDYGSVEIGRTTDYELIDDIGLTFTCVTPKGVRISYKGGVSDSGRHKWTLTVDVKGIVNFAEN
jgi:hypothetical protein